MSNSTTERRVIVRVVTCVVVAVTVATISFAVWWFVVNTDAQTAPETTPEQVSVMPEPDANQIDAEQENSNEVSQEELFDTESIVEVLDTWVASTPGQASVVIADVDGNIISSTDADRQYFAASIYKLYVAYEGYTQLDDGTVDPDELYVNGHTREECLFLMINESDSPCAEKLWTELGKEAVTEKLKGYGLENTSMTALSTSAGDAAVMLSRIATGEGLSVASQEKYVASMETQIFRDALNAGFSEDIIVYNKIGFNELVEYHDTAIIKLADGRQLIVSVLTENVGTKNIAQLATALEAVL